MKPVLVTGGAGYIGSHTVHELIKEGVPVVVLDNLTTGHWKAAQTPHFYQGDIADAALVKHIIQKHQIESVFHLAAKSLVSESIQNPKLYFYENTYKSFVFLEAAIKAGVKHIVFSSTAYVYGVTEKMPISEDTALAPVNPYGASKLMIEEYLELLGKLYEVRWVALRYFNAAGASLDGHLGEDHNPETHLIPLVLKTALGQREILSIFGTDYDTFDGTCMRDYVHVTDLAKAHILSIRALENGLQSKIFNIGTGSGFSVKEILIKSESLCGRKFQWLMKRVEQETHPVWWQILQLSKKS